MSALIAWAIEALVASTVLMVAVLLLRFPVRRAFGADVVYALWALPVLRLFLPPIPQSWREIAVAPVIRASETITYYVVVPFGGNAAAPIAQNPSLGPILVMLWVLGAAVFLVWHALAHLHFCRRMIDQQVRATSVPGGVQLIETGAAHGPLAFGIVRKYVAFPCDFTERYDREERDLALAHELGHHARGDLIANWVALLVLALHWFNPVAWRAFRAFRADQEIANDARVLAGLTPMARHTYACAIVKSAHGGAVSAACHLHTINDLKGRLRMLTTNKTSRVRLAAGTAAILTLTLAGLGLTASGTQAAATIRSNVSETIGVDLATLDIAPPAPAVPAAPPAPAAPPVPATPAIVLQTAVPPIPPTPPVPEIAGEDRDISTVTTTGEDGRTVARTRLAERDRHSHWRSDDDEGRQALRNMPEVSEVNCHDGGSRKGMVITERRGGKPRIIICTNRIEAAAAAGAAMAANSEDIQRYALQSAIAGLRSARAGLSANTDMGPVQRAEALKGIDAAIREVEGEMASAD